MNTPKWAMRASRQEKIDRAVKNLKGKTGFKPGKRYKLNVRKPHRVPGDKNYFTKDNGLLKRNEHWENVEPHRYVNLPDRRDAPGSKTSIQDLTSVKDFKKWFEQEFPNLDDGVYGIIQQKGRDGYYTMFVLQYKKGEVKKFQLKSKSQESRKVGSSARYLGFPYYFHRLQRLGVT